ncbi:MAG: hypothetical protein ACKV2Q_32860 [Planctomycetaceae bacterium]
MSRKSNSFQQCWELVGPRAAPRRRWTRKCLWLGTLMVCLGYIVKLVWFALGGSVQIQLVYDRSQNSSQTEQADEVANSQRRPGSLDDEIVALEDELERDLAQVRRVIEPLILRTQDRDELELHFRTLSTRELLEWLPEWLVKHGYSMPNEVQLRLTISRRRLDQLERALSELGRQS